MSLNIVLYFVWCIFFSFVASQFVSGWPYVILMIISTIAAYSLLIPERKVDDE